MDITIHVPTWLTQLPGWLLLSLLAVSLVGLVVDSIFGLFYKGN